MRSLIKASFLAVGLSISAFAGSDLVPLDQKGNPTLPDYAGASTCEITSSSSTNAVLCDTGAGIILGVYGSSVAASDQIVFRDTATANKTSTRLVTLDLTTLAKGQMFPRYKNGLSVNLNTAATAAGTQTPAWTVIYRALD